MTTHLNFPSHTKKIICSIVFWGSVSCMLLPACTSLNSNREKDGPPLLPRNISAIKDAVPQDEPKSAYGNRPIYEVFGKRYAVMPSAKGYEAQGQASWYGTKFHGRRTSSGEVYDMYGMTAAHKSLPLPTYAKVKNVKNGKEIIVKINDRGPFNDRLIDLSYVAARKLGIYQEGVGEVIVTVISPHEQRIPPSVAPPVPAQDTLPLLASAASPSAYLQFGSFSQKQYAESLMKEASGFVTHVDEPASQKVHIQEEKRPTHKKLFKVRMGPFESPAQAKLFALKLNPLLAAKRLTPVQVVMDRTTQ